MKFKVTDFVTAEPMTRGAYNNLRNWALSPDENGDDEGYLIERTIDGIEPNHSAFKGHITWMPEALFNRTYSHEDMDFGRALDALRLGLAVQRAGWNGAGMFLYLVPEGEYVARTAAAKAYWGEDALVPYLPYTAMKTAQGQVVPWLASQTDVLAYDWRVVTPTKEQ